ncbi:hypothetical protein NECAME_11367 [Necator americanus]|uniref:Uncharacterized protein n=1 Tax=Necator americanus TaxID=51031 RepID=W2T784_NECAM|nr:hypothetical protein NECAME_11367 [Necator americanus]ETN76847.1 hypothetical protein NECAME_11367 [Necator americanus]
MTLTRNYRFHWDLKPQIYHLESMDRVTNLHSGSSINFGVNVYTDALSRAPGLRLHRVIRQNHLRAAQQLELHLNGCLVEQLQELVTRLELPTLRNISKEGDSGCERDASNHNRVSQKTDFIGKSAAATPRIKPTIAFDCKNLGLNPYTAAR